VNAKPGKKDKKRKAAKRCPVKRKVNGATLEAKAHASFFIPHLLLLLYSFFFSRSRSRSCSIDRSIDLQCTVTLVAVVVRSNDAGVWWDAGNLKTSRFRDAILKLIVVEKQMKSHLSCFVVLIGLI